jgi:hypothetical protein
LSYRNTQQDTDDDKGQEQEEKNGYPEQDMVSSVEAFNVSRKHVLPRKQHLNVKTYHCCHQLFE